MKENWQSKIMLFGAIIGAVAGVIAAVVLVQSAEKAGTRPQLSAGDGVKVGLGVLAVMKMMADLGSR